MKPPEEIQVEVFRAGDYGPKGVYTEKDLDSIAADYDPSDHEAPVTLDHEQKGPAQGWVAGLRRLGDRLVAVLHRLSPELAEAVRRGKFRKRSIELYRRYTRTGRPYLKAVSFLGAAAPEVKGLADPLFDDDGAHEVLRFDEVRKDPAEHARAHLAERGVWSPQWEESGLLRVFEALDGTDAYDVLLAFLEEKPAAAPFGRVETEDHPEIEGFAEDLVGGASTGSRARHEEALNLMRRKGIGYRDALLETNHT